MTAVGRVNSCRHVNWWHKLRGDINLHCASLKKVLQLILDQTYKATFYVDPFTRDGKITGWWTEVGRGMIVNLFNDVL